MSLEEFLKNLSENDLNLIKQELHKKYSPIPNFQFSRIKDSDLKSLVAIEENIDRSIFKDWFENSFFLKQYDLNKETLFFLKQLIKENEPLIRSYKEEDLKVYFISPILNRINFKSFKYKIRGFYEEKISYKTADFSFSGTTDFLISNGLLESKQPYFFIQEFKKSEEFSNPRPQLLAELISGVELNDWRFIKGAYIVGAIWNFVILEKLAKNKYQYFISQNFDSTKINDLKEIYQILSFVKYEIIDKVR